MAIYDDYEELGMLVAYEDAPAIEAWLQRGNNINVSNEEGTTCLFLAVMIGSLNMVRLLVHHGADVNHQQNDGRSPLMQAVISGGKCVEFLVESGADLSLKDAGGRTALDEARIWGRQSSIEHLQSRGG